MSNSTDETREVPQYRKPSPWDTTPTAPILFPSGPAISTPLAHEVLTLTERRRAYAARLAGQIEPANRSLEELLRWTRAIETYLRDGGTPAQTS